MSLGGGLRVLPVHCPVGNRTQQCSRSRGASATPWRRAGKVQIHGAAAGTTEGANEVGVLAVSR